MTYSGVFFLTFIVLACIPKVRRTVPANYICLAIFVSILHVFVFVSSVTSLHVVILLKDNCSLRQQSIPVQFNCIMTIRNPVICTVSGKKSP